VKQQVSIGRPCEGLRDWFCRRNSPFVPNLSVSPVSFGFLDFWRSAYVRSGSGAGRDRFWNVMTWKRSLRLFGIGCPLFSTIDQCCVADSIRSNDSTVEKSLGRFDLKLSNDWTIAEDAQKLNFLGPCLGGVLRYVPEVDS
jgi:hypothetical protein